MQIQLKSPKIWISSEPVDFRKAIDGLSEIVVTHFQENIGEAIFVFYNRAKNKVKLLAQHRNGVVLIYKRLNKKRFSFKVNESGLYEITEEQLAWLLAGLNWVEMSLCDEFSYEDYF